MVPLSAGPEQFVGRVAHFPEALDLGNASIRIKKAEVRDSGIYTCTVPRPSPVLRSEISLVVECILKVRPPGEGASPEPLIRTVEGGPDRALLLCEVKGARPRPAVQWQDSSGRVLPAQETESEERDGRFHVTVRAIVSRSGDYSCVVTQEEFCHQINSTTFVPIDCILKVRPPGKGASPEPLIRIVDGGPDRVLLQCEVKGAHTRPAVQWQDSSGRVLPAQETESEERGGRFYVTVRAIVSRSGDYSCVVTQEEFCHQISSTTFVDLGQTPDAESITRRDAAIGVLVVLVVLVAIAAFYFYFKFKALKGELAAASYKSTAVARTPAPDEESSSLKNQAPGSD